MHEIIQKEFLHQEKEDQARMTVYFERAVREELDHPERYLQLLRKKNYHPEEILRLSLKDTPVRVSSEISIRKHTLCQIPYYHTHDFYELLHCMGVTDTLLPYAKAYTRIILLGAAIGTVAGQAVSMAMSIWFFYLSGKSVHHFRLRYLNGKKYWREEKFL